MRVLPRLSARLYAPVILFGILFGAALPILGGAALGEQRQAARNQRIRRMELMTEAAANMIDAARKEAATGAITNEAAKARVLGAVVAMSYGQGDDLFVRDLAGNSLARQCRRTGLYQLSI